MISHDELLLELDMKKTILDDDKNNKHILEQTINNTSIKKEKELETSNA